MASELLKQETKRPIHVFTKCLQFLNYDEIAEVLAGHGFSGADLTVRHGGQILPENVETDLPKAVKALCKAGVDSYMITVANNSFNMVMAQKIKIEGVFELDSTFYSQNDDVLTQLKHYADRFGI